MVSEISKQSKDKESQKGKNKKPSPRVKKTRVDAKIASQIKLPKEKDTTSIKVTVVVQKEDNWYVARCKELLKGILQRASLDIDEFLKYL